MAEHESDFTAVEEDGAIRGYEPQYTDVDGVETRYYDVGEGEPVVLFHGGSRTARSSANDWAPAFEYLQETHRVIAPDRLACGLTGNGPDLAAADYRTDLDHAMAFVRGLDHGSVHLVGFSRGAGLAARMAVEEPELFDTLVMTNSATFGPPTGDRDHRWERLFERWRPSDVEPTDPEYTRHFMFQYSHQLDHITDQYCQTAAWMRGQPKSVRTAEVMAEDDRSERWVESLRDHMAETHRRIRDGVLTMPTLYIFGRNDLTVPLEMAMSAYDLLAQGNSDVRLKVINHCGHMLFREHPREFARTTADFIRFWRA